MPVDEMAETAVAAIEPISISDTTRSFPPPPRGTDLVEWYYEQGWTDGLPVVPPTPEKIEAAVAALGGDLDCVEGGGVAAVDVRVEPGYAPVNSAAIARSGNG